jgi:NAD(P)-dependent dehydrogenase (short-subunit alcohol dehydrogenase family)
MTASLALITGGAQGIGRALAQSFLAEGWRVVVLDRDADALDELKLPANPSGELRVAFEPLITQSNKYI